MHYLAMGGAERALLGLLNAIDTQLVEVDLFLNQHTGEFMPLIPDKINLLPEIKGYNAIERSYKQVLKEGQFSVLFGRLIGHLLYSRYFKSLTDEEKCTDASGFQYIMARVLPFLDPLDDLGEYDLAISFLQPHNIVLNKVRAKKKMAWIHTDYSMMHINAYRELPVWAGYDYIASISPECTRSFVGVFPSLKNRIIEIGNILSTEFIQYQSEQFNVGDCLNDKGLSLLSIGRYTHAKNYDNVPDIARRMVYAGFRDFCWYIIGFGSEEQMIRDKIVEAGMEDYVVLLGKKENPYPYIKACDIYVQPSRYEGKSVTVREAQILCKPVIVTNYPTAKSQIQNGIDGLIVPMDNEACAHGILQAINNPKLLKAISSYLKTHDYGNESEVNKIYKLI